MAKALSNAFSPIRRIINEDYKPADENYPMGGTIVPSATTDDPESSGVKFAVHAEKLTGCNLVSVADDGSVKTVPVSPRAMEILREGNRDQKKMSYEQAIKMAQAEEEAKAKSEAQAAEKAAAAEQAQLQKLPFVQSSVVGVDMARGPDYTAAAVIPVPQVGTHSNIEEPDYMKAQRAAKPEKKGKRSRAAAAPSPSPKIPVSFSSSLGQMAIMAERVFISGPNNICLVIIQYSPEGHFYVPPQVDEPIMISFQGQVYKCLTGIYYQLPGTPVMHTVYFIAKE